MSVPEPDTARHAELVVDLPSGPTAHAYIADSVILVDHTGRACIAHPRWFDQATAHEMIRALQSFVDR